LGFATVTYDTDLGGWDPDPNTTIDYGGGAFVKNPGALFTLTFVGEVGQGTLLNPAPTGFSILSSKVPQQGLITTDLQFPPSQGDVLYKYLNPGGFQTSTYDTDLGGWDPQEPSIEVGEGFYMKSTGHAWTRTFNVN
jgi:hypothetical protein